MREDQTSWIAPTGGQRLNRREEQACRLWDLGNSLATVAIRTGLPPDVICRAIGIRPEAIPVEYADAQAALAKINDPTYNPSATKRPTFTRPDDFMSNPFIRRA